MDILSTVREDVAPFVGDSGSCPDDPKTLEAINNARRILYGLGDWQDTIEPLCIRPHCWVITLPAAFEFAKRANVCCRPVVVENDWFSIVHNYSSYCCGSGYALTRQAGNYITFRDWPCERPTKYVCPVIVNETETPVTFGIVGDNGRDNAASNLVAAMIKTQAPQEVILLGDNNYETGSAATIDANVGKKWRTYMFPWLGNSGIAPLGVGEVDATENHLWAVPGNHDWGNTLNPAGLNPHLAYFSLRGNERYYSKRFGPVEVFFLDSDYNEPDGIAIGSVQYQWFVENARISTARWKIAVMHHTPKTTGPFGGPSPGMDWDFHNHGIHVVMAGHVHAYERWEENGVIYYTVGSGASNLDNFSLESPYSKFRWFSGALFLEATTAKLTFTFRNQFGDVIDVRELVNTDPVAVQHCHSECPPNGFRVKVVFESPADTGKMLIFRGHGADHRDVSLTRISGGAYIPSIGDSTDQWILSLNYVIKPRTVGRVRVYAYDGANEELLIALYEPDDVNPQLTRYSVGTRTNVVLKAKKRFVRLFDDNQPVDIATDALIHTLQALTDRRNRNLSGYSSNIGLAVAFLNRQLANPESTSTTPIQMSRAYHVSGLIE